ncbi:MAG TPA: PKD domain-containing protein [Gemmatimonadales bacterium]
MLLTWLLAGCGGGDLVLPKSGRPTAIRVVEGDGQSGSAGQPLAAPVTVEVTDADSEPVEGATVEFALTSAGDGGEMRPSSAPTDAGGRAQAQVQLGSKVGLQIGEARVVQGGGSVKTSFTALAGAPGQTNHPPQADFDSQCDGLTCRFTDASSDSDGNLTGWSWSFGDGDASTERAPVHTYSGPGTYTVTLSVTDGEGSSDDTSTQVTVSAASPPTANTRPRAEFAVSCQELRCTFTDQSNDPDGSIAGRRWDFGDGHTSTSRNPSHSYETAGQYQVVLTVTDDEGATSSKSRTADPAAPASPPPAPQPSEPNKPPAADFEVHCSGLTCSFTDRSKDDDGTVVQWRWSFGDGATSSDRNPIHAYESGGRYQVLLTTTDNDGAADAKSRTAEPEAPAPPTPPPPPPPPPPPEEPNKPPHADFDVHCDKLTCTFTDRSKDDDGTIVQWQWSFGDGGSSNQQNPVYTYAGKGRFNVVVTVTDNDGASATKSRRTDPKD